VPEFRHAPDGAILVLDAVESQLLRQLAAEMRALLTGSNVGNGPVLDRLFPDTYDEPDDESAYREIVGDSLLDEKLRALDTVSTALADGPTEVTITGEEFDTWLACLTDLRLAVGTRLDIDEERMGAEIDPRDPNVQALTVLHWLGWLQEGLLRSVAS
jgi:hypothetical protein